MGVLTSPQPPLFPGISSLLLSSVCLLSIPQKWTGQSGGTQSSSYGFLSAALISLLNGNSSGRDAVNPWAHSSALPDRSLLLCKSAIRVEIRKNGELNLSEKCC